MTDTVDDEARLQGQGARGDRADRGARSAGPAAARWAAAWSARRR